MLDFMRGGLWKVLAAKCVIIIQLLPVREFFFRFVTRYASSHNDRNYASIM